MNAPETKPAPAAESDASGGEARLVLTRDEVVEMLRVFLPAQARRSR